MPPLDESPTQAMKTPQTSCSRYHYLMKLQWHLQNSRAQGLMTNNPLHIPRLHVPFHCIYWWAAIQFMDIDLNHIRLERGESKQRDWYILMSRLKSLGGKAQLVMYLSHFPNCTTATLIWWVPRSSTEPSIIHWAIFLWTALHIVLCWICIHQMNWCNWRAYVNEL